MSQMFEEIQLRYRRLALEWLAASGDANRANRIFKRHHTYYKEIRNTPDGQYAIEGLLSDPVPEIRLLAATHCLRIVPNAAVSVLEDLAAGTGRAAIDAIYTLESYRKGRLNLDW